jgi:hypothetical protein
MIENSSSDRRQGAAGGGVSRTGAASSFRVILLIILAVFLTLPSCNDESPTECVVYDVGAVEGYVLSAGEGLSVRVQARGIGDSRAGNVITSTESDTTGWYRLELPVGLYRLEVNPSTTFVPRTDMRDTVRVDRRVHRHDLIRGRAEVELRAPADLNGRTIGLSLIGGDEAYGYARAYATLENGEGRFVFPAVQPNRFLMYVEGGGLSTRVFLPGTSDAYAADSLVVDVTETAAYVADFTTTYASISGRITGSWQQLGRGTLSVRAYSSWMREIGYTYCSADGAFLLDFIGPQRVRLRLSYNWLYQWMGGASFETARVFDVRPGDRITDASTVVSGLQVFLEGPGNLTTHVASYVLRDEQSNQIKLNERWDEPVVFGILRPGRYFIHVNGYCHRQTWAAQWYDGAETADAATPIDLVEGELRDVTLHLVDGGRISGGVLTATGERPVGVYGRIYDSAGEPLCEYGQVWAAGIFDLVGLPDGDYYLSASMDPDDNPWWYPGTFDFQSAVAIPIVGHSAVGGITWSLPPSTAKAVP